MTRQAAGQASIRTVNAESVADAKTAKAEAAAFLRAVKAAGPLRDGMTIRFNGVDYKVGNKGTTFIADGAVKTVEGMKYVTTASDGRKFTATVTMDVWGYTIKGSEIGKITASNMALFQGASGPGGAGLDLPAGLTSNNLRIGISHDETRINILEGGSLVVVGEQLMPLTKGSTNIELLAGCEVEGKKILSRTTVDVDAKGAVQFRDGARVRVVQTGFIGIYNKGELILKANQAVRSVTYDVAGKKVTASVYVDGTGKALFANGSAVMKIDFSGVRSIGISIKGINFTAGISSVTMDAHGNLGLTQDTAIRSSNGDAFTLLSKGSVLQAGPDNKISIIAGTAAISDRQMVHTNGVTTAEGGKGTSGESGTQLSM